MNDIWIGIGRIADIVSLIGLIGLAIAIWQVVGSKRAAQRAEEAALKMREVILRSDTMMDFSAAVTIMEEIKRLHRTGNWHILLERYTTLRKMLISIRSSNANLSEKYLTDLQSAIQQFSKIESQVEKSIQPDSKPPNVAKLNEIVSAQIDKLNEVLTTIRREIGMENYGKSETGNSN